MEVEVEREGEVGRRVGVVRWRGERERVVLLLLLVVVVEGAGFVGVEWVLCELPRLEFSPAPPRRTRQTVSSSFSLGLALILGAEDERTSSLFCTNREGSSSSSPSSSTSLPFPFPPPTAPYARFNPFRLPPGVHPHPPGATGVATAAGGSSLAALTGLMNIRLRRRAASCLASCSSSSSSSDESSSRADKSSIGEGGVCERIRGGAGVTLAYERGGEGKSGRTSGGGCAGEVRRLRRLEEGDEVCGGCTGGVGVVERGVGEVVERSGRRDEDARG